MLDEFCPYRFERGIQQNLFVFNFDTSQSHENILKFEIYGTSRTIYDVLFDHVQVSCTCMDFKTRNLYCKHIYFIIGKIGKLSLNQIEEIMENPTENGTNTNRTRNQKQKKLKSILHQIVNALQNSIKQFKSGDGETCCVCIDEMHPEHQCMECENCKNKFHKICLLSWLSGKRGCPLCRKSIVQPPILMKIENQ